MSKPKTQVRITGLDDVQKNLKVMLKGTKRRTRKGVLDAAMHVQGAAQAYTPVLTGNLKGSFQVKVIEPLSGPVGVVENAAAYSLAVHELRIPFLTIAMAEEADQIVHFITRAAHL